MKFEVVIRNLTPVFSAAPGASTVTLEGVINPPEGVSRFPLTRMRTMGVVADSGDGEVRVENLPIVPGGTMRNLLRRAMLKHVVEPALRAKEAQLGIGAYAATYAGNSSGNPDGVPSAFDEVVSMRAHPFIGLFGGGPRMLEGRLMVDSLYPIHQHALRVIGSDYINESLKGRITQIVWARRVDPILQLGSAEDASVIAGGVAAVNGWISDLMASTKAKKGKGKKGEEAATEAVEDSARGLKAFNAHEVVIPGVSWLWRISVDNPSDAQVGLILLALSKLNSLRIAGGHAKGYGEFEIDAVRMDGESIWSCGSVAGEGLGRYWDAVSEALDAMTPVDFERFAASAKEE